MWQSRNTLTNIKLVTFLDHHSRAKALLRDDIYSNSHCEDAPQASVAIQIYTPLPDYKIWYKFLISYLQLGL